MVTTIKSQAYNSWTVPSKKLAGIILNFIEKSKEHSPYYDSYKGYDLQLTRNGKALVLSGDILQPVVSSSCSGYDWYNYKRGVIKVFNIDERKFEPVEEVAIKPIPSWFAKMCAVLADKDLADSYWYEKANPLMKSDSIWSIF